MTRLMQFVTKSRSPMMTKLLRAIATGGTSYARYSPLSDYISSEYVFLVDTQVFLVDALADDVQMVLDGITETEVGTSVVVVKPGEGAEEAMRAHIKAMSKNSLFYLAIPSANSENTTWNQVISLKSGAAVSPMMFHPGSFAIKEVIMGFGYFQRLFSAGVIISQYCAVFSAGTVNSTLYEWCPPCQRCPSCQ